MPAKTPDDYMREMMEMHRRASASQNQTSRPEPAPRPEPMPRPEPAPRPEPIPRPEPAPMPEPAPEPETPIIIPGDTPSPETSFGWLQVTARAASQAQPLEGVSVQVTRGDELLYTLLTDQSGTTPRVQLPAPAITNTPVQPFSVYNVSAYLEGYSRLRSQAVPVFSGVTTIQPFQMIPLPQGGDPDTVTTNQNTEPEF